LKRYLNKEREEIIGHSHYTIVIRRKRKAKRGGRGKISSEEKMVGGIQKRKVFLF